VSSDKSASRASVCGTSISAPVSENGNPIDDTNKEDAQKDEAELYNISNFSV
jgi:hypothetical protein